MAIDTDYLIDFEKKKIYYNSKGSKKIYSVNELYSYLQDVFDEPDAMDDEIPIHAVSKNKYLLINGWKIDEAGMKHLTGGTLKSKVTLKT